MRVIVSDTSPIRYLVLIGSINVVERLYTRVLIPEAVHVELQQPHTPEVVRTWITSAPNWVEVMPPPHPETISVSAALGDGERQAIALALHCKADLLLIDDRSGAREARRLGLSVTGTLGILVRASEAGLLDLPAALRRLQQTNFRINPKIVRELIG